MADDLKDNNHSGLPEGVKTDEYGNVIAPSERSKPAPRQLSADEKKEKRKADVLKLFEIKRLPTRFGRRQAALGEQMCATRSAYIEALQSDEEFLDNLIWIENRNISGLTSDLAYKLYKEGYEIEQQERADEANAANAKRSARSIFRYGNCLRKRPLNLNHNNLEPRMDTGGHEMPPRRGRQSSKVSVVDYGILNAETVSAAGGSAVRMELCVRNWH